MYEEKYSTEAMVDAVTALVAGSGDFRITVGPDDDGGSGTTVRGEGNPSSLLKSAHTMLIAYMNTQEGLAFEDALERLECLQHLAEDACDTQILKSITPKGEKV